LGEPVAGRAAITRWMAAVIYSPAVQSMLLLLLLLQLSAMKRRHWASIRQQTLQLVL